MKFKLIIAFICLALSSCQNSNNLKSYNPEMEKVLNHYKVNDIDEQKYEAAKFLIDNMNGHSSIRFRNQKTYCNTIDSLYGNESYHIKKLLYGIPNTLGYGTKYKSDLENITSKYLIDHIDYWVNVWRTAPWLSELSFDDFLNYLLPYRFMNEKLQNNESNLFRQNIDTLITLSNKYEWLKFNIYSHIEWHDIYMLPKEANFINDSIYIPKPINKKIKLDCFQLANYYNYYYRQHGIPSAIDFVPYWGHISYRHAWCATIDGIFTYNTKEWFVNTLTAKVYRFTYRHNPIITDGENFVPSLFRNPFVIDITEKYVTVSDAKLKLDYQYLNKKPKYVYLSVFNNKSLKEIAVAKTKGKNITFKNLGRRNVFFPICYEGRTPKAVDYPFSIDSNEKIQHFIPNKSILETRKITRKDRIEAKDIFSSLNMRGLLIEGSNKSDFSNKKTIYKITEYNEDLNILNIPINGKYRYIRILEPKDSVQLSVLKFYDKNGIIKYINKNSNLNNLIDNDILTYQTIKGGLTIDFGEKKELQSVNIAPRSDDNGIVADELYELFYYDLNGWNSLGRKFATTNYIEYSEMPKGAIFWLRNHTKGIEERIFTFDKDGKQRFW